MTTFDKAQQYLRGGGVDPNAAVHAIAHRTVHATADTLYDVLSDLASWPAQVRPTISAMAVSGPIAAGTRFDWTQPGGTAHSTLAVVDPGREVSWHGRAMWFTVVHRNVITPGPDSTCTMTSEESMDGVGIRLLYPPAKLERELQAWLADFATAAERRSGRRAD
ncbi:SRPBCC family protein [Nocardia stercoris]|uniref:SRPBCC family protein n=1 Tax=Nocardia stercoris TaxID=2483361 RepID=A0A3M2L1A9_9NOCA|nr:SRPBCC family protein [Nocardia stercoris]RMI31164.1 hypothetical protein EBN03_17400 [Nocardia stercoris]